MNSHCSCPRTPHKSLRRRSNHSRRGFGLIDMISVIGLVGLLMSLSAVVLNRAYGAHRKALVHFRQMQHLQNAYQRFLHDSHDSANIDVADGMASFVADGRHIKYSIQRDRLVRSVEVEGSAFSHESWQLPSACTASWSVDRSGRVPIVGCELTFNDVSQNLRPIQWLSRCELAKSDVDQEQTNEL